jgi:hypothetical protein
MGDLEGAIGTGVMGDLSGAMATGVTGELTVRDSIGLLVVAVVVGWDTGTMLRESFGLTALEANILTVLSTETTLTIGLLAQQEDYSYRV